MARTIASVIGLVLAAVFGYLVWRSYQTRIDFERGSQEPITPPRRKPKRKRKKRPAAPDADESTAEGKGASDEAPEDGADR